MIIYLFSEQIQAAIYDYFYDISTMVLLCNSIREFDNSNMSYDILTSNISHGQYDNYDEYVNRKYTKKYVDITQTETFERITNEFIIAKLLHQLC